MRELLWAGIAVIGGAGGFFWGFRLWRRLRLIQDTPTAKARSMPLGRVELHGHAQEKAELQAPLTGRPCVYYRYKVEELRGSGKNRRWVTVESGDSSAWGFYIADETGRVLVIPDGARIDIAPDLRRQEGLMGLVSSLSDEIDTRPWAARGWLGRHGLYFTEWRIDPGDELYVLGVGQERPGLAYERRHRITAKLRALKSDPEAMTHLDTDGDGGVSASEWEVARQLAVREIALEPIEDRVVIGADRGGDAPFYLSDRDEREVLTRHLWQAVAGVLGGPALSVGSLWFLLARLGLLGG